MGMSEPSGIIEENGISSNLTFNTTKKFN